MIIYEVTLTELKLLCSHLVHTRALIARYIKDALELKILSSFHFPTKDISYSDKNNNLSLPLTVVSSSS